MKFKLIKEPLSYDGHQIGPMWALKELNVKGSSFVSWIGPMNIINDELIDYDDFGIEIKSDLMLHFIIEHFDCQPANLKLCYYRQRILVTLFKDILYQLGVNATRDGDDLFVVDGKLSVSIATCSVSSMKIHFGINVSNEGTPKNIETAALMDLIDTLTIDEVFEIAEKLYENYHNEINSIEMDITKTRVF